MSAFTQSSVLASLLLCLVAGTARADAIQLQSAAAGATSSWEGDSAVLGSGTLGYRLDRQLTLQILGHGGYAGLGHRVLTAVGVGVQVRSRGGRVRPYLRAALLRATEQPVENVADDPLGALLGTSGGVAHRFGATGAAGVEIPVARSRGVRFYLSAELSMTVFREGSPPPTEFKPLVLPGAPACPRTYTGFALGLGLEFDLPRRRNRP